MFRVWSYTSFNCNSQKNTNKTVPSTFST